MSHLFRREIQILFFRFLVVAAADVLHGPGAWEILHFLNAILIPDKRENENYFTVVGLAISVRRNRIVFNKK